VAFDVHEGLDNTLVILGHLLKQYNIERSYGPVPLVFGRPGSTNQVWTNLLANAAEALAGEGTIRISTAVHDDLFVRVSIEDNGRGIPSECMEKIWEINYTTKKSSSNFGLGLGLAISRSIVEEQGGRIWAEASPGHTVFHTLLPIAIRLED
jgi:signal transduction histidine kinase